MVSPRTKQYLLCEVLSVRSAAPGVFHLDCAWPGGAPGAGQFFMVKPGRSAVFLPRPLSVSGWRAGSRTLSFLVAERGRGTRELAGLRPGERIRLAGPLGNGWEDFLPPEKAEPEKPLALAGGGAGIAPLLALADELSRRTRAFDFFAGFKTRSFGLENLKARSLIVASEDGSEGRKGLIPEFLRAERYAAVYACGPEGMLWALGERCGEVPCYVSMERRMACGVGACLGCTVQAAGGNRRCCADGPVFPAKEVFV
ncbi:MAG: dihydroorotate dehydrogenase electron transfer subunit [Treponema sp.]|jgi:NAD(P)H-flavin reductase|nr:dihydroorotate dehydrogenase electron transfer subunit [Treponema sp.]